MQKHIARLKVFTGDQWSFAASSLRSILIGRSLKAERCRWVALSPPSSSTALLEIPVERRQERSVTTKENTALNWGSSADLNLCFSLSLSNSLGLYVSICPALPHYVSLYLCLCLCLYVCLSPPLCSVYVPVAICFLLYSCI